MTSRHGTFGSLPFPRFAIGIGARRGVDADELVELVRNVFIAAAIDCEPTQPRSPSPMGRRWPGEAGSDEGTHPPLFAREQRGATSYSWAAPHPTPLRGATFSLWEKELRTESVDVLAIFTIDSRQNESGLDEAARRLNTRIVFLPLAALVARKDDVLTRSPRIEALMGVGSVAEAAALVGAGPGSLLLGPRIASARATCAIARNALEEAP